MVFRFRGRSVGVLGITSVLLCSAGALSCDLAQNLTDVGGALTNPDAALLDRPGRKLASGSYHHLLVDGSLESGGHVVAIRTDRGQDEVAIIPYLKGSGCSVSPGIAVERISSRIDVELSGMLAVQHNKNENGRGEITFVDFDCKELNKLEDASLPQIAFPFTEPRGFLTADSSGVLYFVNARNQEIRTIAEGVTVARTAGDSLWTLENGEIVIRGGNLREIARTGNGVLEFVVSGGSKITAAYRDSEGISIWTEEDGSTLISETGCGLVGWGVDAIAFTAPCGGGELHAYTLGSRIGSDEEFVEIIGPSGVSYPERALPTWGQDNRPTEVILTLSDPEQPGDILTVARVPEEPSEDGTYRLELEQLSADSAVIRGGKIFTDWNGTTGTLVELERDEDGTTTGLIEIAENVAQLIGDGPYSPLGVLVDYADGVGTLKAFRKRGADITSEVLAENVPLQTHFTDEESGRRLFIAHSQNGSVGDLYLADEPVGRTPPDSQKIAENVYIDTARFLDQPRGVAYLAKQTNSDYVALRVWLEDSDLTLTIHKAVSEYRTVPWPAPGILYAVPAGDDQGLWFSKAR